jgi:lysine/ornithine N-monooxygenase
LVEWLELKKLKFTAVPNSTFSWAYFAGQKKKNFTHLARLHRQWLRKGFPDLVIWIAPHQAECWEACIVFIELKRLKGSEVKPEQEEWVACLEQVKWCTEAICYGCKDAINFISSFLV